MLYIFCSIFNLDSSNKNSDFPCYALPEMKEMHISSQLLFIHFWSGQFVFFHEISCGFPLLYGYLLDTRIKISLDENWQQSPSMVFTPSSTVNSPTVSSSERGTANWIEQLRILLQIWTPKLSTSSPEEWTNLKRTMRSEVFDMKTWHSRTVNLETSNIQWHLNETSCLAIYVCFF